jgi:hypothetical protein
VLLRFEEMEVGLVLMHDGTAVGEALVAQTEREGDGEKGTRVAVGYRIFFLTGKAETLPHLQQNLLCASPHNDALAAE